MSSDLLIGVWVKIDRAKKHFAELESAIADFHASDPYRVEPDSDSEPGQELYRIRFNRTIPSEWGGIIGDVIHNLRSALDNLATAMTILNGRTSNTIINETYFPIGADKQGFETKLLKQMRGVSPLVQRLVARLKPYKGGADAFWRIHQLDIRDKHTLLIPVGASHTAIKVGFDKAKLFNALGIAEFAPVAEIPPLVLRPSATQYPLEDGDIILRSEMIGEFENDYQATFDIAFGEGQIVDGQPVIPTLKQFIDFIERVIQIFERRIFS